MLITPQEHFLKLCIFGKYDELIDFYNMHKNSIDISYNNEEAFWWSCGNGFLNLAKWLLSEKPTINISANNEQAFRVACASGKLSVLKWLIQIKPDIDISVFDERSFTNACFSGNLEVVSWLLEIKPSIDITAEKHYGICVAAQYKHYSIVNYLFELYTLKNLEIDCLNLEYLLSNNKLWLYTSLQNDNKVECSICYDSITKYRKTPCNHIYCKTCIQTWIATNNHCPYCRCIL